MGDHPGGAGIGRRGFLTSIGAGALGATALASAPGEAAPAAVVAAGDTVAVPLTVNGIARRVTVEPLGDNGYKVPLLRGLVAERLTTLLEAH